MKNAWRFEPGEPLDEAFRRVAKAEIGAARAGLARADGDRDKAIHEARRAFKRLRALVRLASPGLEDGFGKENHRLRDAGRLLAPARDAAVLLDAFDRFVAEYGSDGSAALDPAALAALRERLAEKPTSRAQDPAAIEAHTARVVAMTERAERNLARLPWPADADRLERGLRKAQARMKASFRAARDTGRADELHDWRKRLKDVSSQTELFASLLPVEAGTGRKQAREIARILGDEHDLCLLGDRLASLRVPAKVREARDALTQRIEARRRKLRQKVFRLGEASVSREAEGFARDVSAAWETRRAEA